MRLSPAGILVTIIDMATRWILLNLITVTTTMFKNDNIITQQYITITNFQHNPVVVAIFVPRSIFDRALMMQVN